MVDFGGVQVAELSQNTKDGLLDPLNDRTAPATAANPLATIQDVLSLGGGSGPSLQLTKQEAQVNGGGAFSTPSQVFVDVPGAVVSFTLSFPRVVILEAFATALGDGANGMNAQLALNVDGTDFPGTSGYGPGATLRQDVNAQKAILLAAGLHTIKARVRKPTVQAGNAILNTTANEYVSITAVYNSPGSPDTGAIIMREERVATAGLQPVNSATFVDVPDTAFSFVLTVPATVILMAQGAWERNGGFISSDFSAAIRVDGVDYPVQRFRLGIASGSGNYSMALEGLKTLDLAAGLHTVVLRAKNNNLANDPVLIRSTVDSPTTLLAMWSMPVFGAALLDVVEQANSSGGIASTPFSGYQLLAGTAIAFNLSVQQNVVFQGDVTALPDGAGKSSIQLGVRIDGIDYPGDVLDTNNLPSFITAALHVNKGVLLAVGPHTAQLIYKVYNALNASAAIISLAPTSPAKLKSIKSDAQVLAVNKFTIDHAIQTPPTGVGTGLVPGTLLSFTCAAGKAIVWGSCYFTGSFSVPSNFLYIVLDGNVGSPIPLNGYASVNGSGGDRDLDNPAGGNLGLTLTAGLHTVQLYVGTNSMAAVEGHISLIYPTP